MVRARNHKHDRNGGFITVLALVMVIVTMAVAVGMVAGSSLRLAQTGNLRAATAAQLAAESGLAFAQLHMTGVDVSGASAEEMMLALHQHLAPRLNGTNGLAGDAVAYDDSDPQHPFITVPAIALPNGSSFALAVDVADANTLAMTVTGTYGRFDRYLQVKYGLAEEKKVLTYALASRPRIIARGNVHVDGDLCSTWTRTSEAAPLDISLGTGGEVTGGIKTVLSEEAFDADGCADYVSSDLRGKLSYDEPPFAEYTTEDFDTSPYRDLASSPLPAYDYRQYEGFPETNPRKWFRRKFYVGTAENPKVLNNVNMPAGTNAHFKNCTFTGYTYIEQGNNVVFENCSFEGPIITGVPSEFQWIDHSLYFKGDTTIGNDLMPESTILAPNFNVNIGDFSKDQQTSSSKITGILVGGIVDIRDNAVIEGTILSMANLDHISSSIAKYGSNLGYWEGDAEEGGGSLPETMNIRITPQPDNLLPLGMRKRYSLAPVRDSYVELPAD